jgi:hypothetical protein
MKNADMPVSPCEYFHTNQDAPAGLTKREEFASRNMAAILANSNYEAPRRHRFAGMADDALAAADALLAAIEADRSELARHQPCGCVICVCEDDEQCQGCGAKSCGKHQAGEIPNPVYESSEADHA